MKIKILLLLFGMCTMFQAAAHVDLKKPIGTETFNSGDLVLVEWQILISHTLENWDLYFSEDGGNTWIELQMDIPSTGAETGTIVTYEWIVPELETSQARIKIVMDNEGVDYSDVSEDFTITAAASGISEQVIEDQIKIYPNPFTDFTTIVFENAENEDHILTIYDSRGRLVRTITKIKTDKVIVSGEDLLGGLYFFQLCNNREACLTGKLIIE